MEKKCLIIHIPVLHKGYLDFFRSHREKISAIYIIDEELLEECSRVRADIASLSASCTKDILKGIGFFNISLLSKSNVDEIKDKELILVQDEVSRNLYAKYLTDTKIEWVSVFLRWDKDAIVLETPHVDAGISEDPFDTKMMKEAYSEAQKSSDWWRQVGAVLIQDKKIAARAYNQGVPTDHTPYQVGAVRDFFKPGEKPELVNYIHAEQRIIAEAAKNGMALGGASLYVTHFPCPVCAKLIAYAGIKNLYFGEGSSVLDGKQTLESAGVRIFLCQASPGIGIAQ